MRNCELLEHITPYGTILEHNIENNLTITVNDAIVIMPAPTAILKILC